MNRDEVLVQLQSIFDDLFLTPVRLTRELRAVDVPEWDSLMQVSLVLTVEEQFGIRFVTGEVEATRSVGEFVDLIAVHASRKI
jgi:acyl carrier protein